MRRARIKAFAAVPVRKKPLQDSVDSIDTNDTSSTEKKTEDVSNEVKYEAIKDFGRVEEQKKETPATIETSKQEKQKEIDISITDIPQLEKQKEENIDTNALNDRTVKDAKEENAKRNQNKISAKESTNKADTEELCSLLKLDSQELSAQLNSQETTCTKVKSSILPHQSVQKSISLLDVPTTIDTASPTKVIQSRPCFMRPTPRLDSGGRIRKNSIQGSGASASESEDEHSKRVASVVPTRVRNDSICSVQSNKESNINDNQTGPPKFKTSQKRRMLVSESARKLAEARREFLLKHENRTPDRSQLKMYDLIYYNPVTNPMKKISVERKQVTTPQPVEITEEEEEDDPSAMPTPQVKVGPDGQLIIDEQSLVIEQTDAKKDGEILATEATVEDDNSHGGFYKKHKRSKEWPKWETFKFYRVLNVVGTDFLLMQTLFPNRSRQEIKQKYKKEERINRPLVEKALKYHQEFDTDVLEEQLAMLQKLENIPNTSKGTSEKIKSEPSLSVFERKRKRRLVAKSIGECETLSNNQEIEDFVVSTKDNELNVEINNDISNAQEQLVKESKLRKSKKRSNDEFETLDDYSSDTNAESDSSEEVYQPRPTRSGRLSNKMRRLQAPVFSIPNNIKTESLVNEKNELPSHIEVEVTEFENTSVTNKNTETSCSESIMTMIPNINQMEPGALVIVSKESAENPGNTILQVYMVASNIDSSTTVTPSAASGNEPRETL